MAHRVGLRGADAQDAVQKLLTLLLVGGENEVPYLETYRGEGTLEAWVRVAAVRLFRRTMHRTVVRREALTESAGALVLQPELALLGHRYAQPIEEAVRRAVRSLDNHLRAILALHVNNGLNDTQVAAMYRVHRTTAGRWVEAAQKKVVQAVQRDLGAREGLSPRDVKAIALLLKSALHVSIGRLAARGTDEGEG